MGSRYPSRSVKAFLYKKCRNVPKKTCETIPQQKCKSVPSQECGLISKKVCSKLPEKACIELCKDVFWCKVCTHPQKRSHGAKVKSHGLGHRPRYGYGYGHG